MGNDFDFRFHWRDDLSGFMRQTEHLAVARPGVAAYELWLPSEARWWTDPEPNAQLADPERFYINLPRGTREALIAEFAPHADAGEVKALREALEVERRRVDELLALIARPTMVMT